MVLAGATTIKRERVPNEFINQLIVFYGTVDADGVSVGVDDGVGVGVVAVAVGAGKHEGATSCRLCCLFFCGKCKKHDEDSIMYLHKLSEAVNELKKKSDAKGIVSKNVRHAYTPKAKRRKESFAKAMQNLKRKMFGESVIKLTSAKDIRIEYVMHVFTGQDFRSMTSLTVLWDDRRHWKYPDYYDPRDRILDLNFYTNFLHRYNQMSDEATMSGGKSMSQLLDDFVWDDDVINYVRGIRPTP
ncbi:hypothetical protein EJD97_007068 [Solanum chilense]|uniref:Uncharacterized protein n=1 Tax=Solanum chilense TaxID=4083 RepID=A0A6N2CCM2_SOLCI|nr:hypothetical protein EJD97_007068 [Solanum chilense]